MKGAKELILLICLAFLVRIPWLLMVPQAEAPDENTHLWVIEFIAKNWFLPDYHSIVSAGPQAVYGSIPQFGYLPHILFYKCLAGLFSPQYSFLAARLGSVLMGLVVVSVSYFIGRLLFVPNRIFAIAVPLLVIFHPQFVFVTSYTNNDSTAAALSALILLLLIISFKKGLNLYRALMLSGCFSLLVLSKYSGYSVLLMSGLALILICYLHKTKLKQQVVLLLSIGILSMLLTSWWFVHNYHQFAGDITGVKTMHHIWSLTYHKKLQEFQSPILILFHNRFWRMLFFSFWGWFGYMTRSLPRVIYYTYLLFVIVASVRFIDRCVDRWQKKKIHLSARVKALFTAPDDSVNLPINRLSTKNLQRTRDWTWLLLIVCFLLNFATCVYGLYSGVAGPQGRYLFPSEISIMAMFIAGLAARPNKWSENLVLTFVAYNFIVYCYSSYFLFCLYS